MVRTAEVLGSKRKIYFDSYAVMRSCYFEGIINICKCFNFCPNLLLLINFSLCYKDLILYIKYKSINHGFQPISTTWISSHQDPIRLIITLRRIHSMRKIQMMMIASGLMSDAISCR